MRTVPSKYNGYPWAFTWPPSPPGVGPIDHAKEVNGWLKEHGLRHNYDYVAFEIDESPNDSRFANWTYCIAFKNRDVALMYKMAWA